MYIPCLKNAGLLRHVTNWGLAGASPCGLQILRSYNFKGKKELCTFFVILNEIELFLSQQIKDRYNKIFPCKIKGMGQASVQPNSSKFLAVLAYITKSYVLHKA